MEEKNLNTVQTVFSQTDVHFLESFIYDYWNEADHERHALYLMRMLAIYVEHPQKINYKTSTPAEMTEFVSSCIQMNDRLKEIMNDTKPWEWEDTQDGWAFKADK